MNITVVGAGYMGSALCFPLCENSHAVSLCGTHLDNDIITSCRNGAPHTRLKKNLPHNISLFHYSDLKKSLERADAVIIAVLSEGFSDIFNAVLENISDMPVFMTVTKGFSAEAGNVKRISKAAFDLFSGKFSQPFPWISIGGPVKAVELSLNIPTASVYAGINTDVSAAAAAFSASWYQVFPADDVTGLELCSALKNIYSIAQGICDGLYADYNEGLFDNIKAALFGCAVDEMGDIIMCAGGKKETAAGLAGSGDLYVTSLSGRNRKYGELLGKGYKPAEAYRQMLDQAEAAEGYMTLKHASDYIEKSFPELKKKLPLFSTLYDIVFNSRDVNYLLTSIKYFAKLN